MKKYSIIDIRWLGEVANPVNDNFVLFHRFITFTSSDFLRPSIARLYRFLKEFYEDL